MVSVAQPTGLRYVGGVSCPGAPWTGLELYNWDNLVPGGSAMVCVMMDGAPIPMGSDVPFARSHDRGTADVFTCPAARVYGDQPLCVPGGATVLVATMDVGRQVYVVSAAKSCEKTRPERVQRKSVSSCHGG